MFMERPIQFFLYTTLLSHLREKGVIRIKKKKKILFHFLFIIIYTKIYCTAVILMGPFPPFKCKGNNYSSSEET